MKCSNTMQTLIAFATEIMIFTANSLTNFKRIWTASSKLDYLEMTKTCHQYIWDGHSLPDFSWWWPVVHYFIHGTNERLSILSLASHEGPFIKMPGGCFPLIAKTNLLQTFPYNVEHCDWTKALATNVHFLWWMKEALKVFLYFTGPVASLNQCNLTVYIRTKMLYIFNTNFSYTFMTWNKWHFGNRPCNWKIKHNK